MAVVLATLSSAQVISNPFFSYPATTTSDYYFGPVIPGPIPGHEKEFVCAFRPGEQKSCCTTGGDTPSECVAAPPTTTSLSITITFGKRF
ncbi:hypothetical protein DL95DRAFT_528012 [Leptodontidium sp. 2 PMI_412]|nr:hypothetical protein DL95DRAFT_528012 [Leptodontidium sp. 2 PMI_412]